MKSKAKSKKISISKKMALAALKSEKQTKLKKDLAPPQSPSLEKIKETNQEHEEEKDQTVIGSITPQKEDRTNYNAQDCEVLGYILLSKPAYVNDIDPVSVGCVFFNTKTQKYFLRVRKLMFVLNYLLTFISHDPVTGQ